MAGTREGGLRAYKKISERDPGFYQRIGKIGGSKKGDKGFRLMDKEKVRAAGSKGGKVSRRTKSTYNATVLETKIMGDSDGIQ